MKLQGGNPKQMSLLELLYWVEVEKRYKKLKIRNILLFIIFFLIYVPVALFVFQTDVFITGLLACIASAILLRMNYIRRIHFLEEVKQFFIDQRKKGKI